MSGSRTRTGYTVTTGRVSNKRGRSSTRSSPRRSRSASPAPRSRAALPAPARKAAAPKTQGSQMGYKTATLTLAKPMSRAAMTAKLTQSMLESVIYRWNGVKAFSGSGFYWMQNRVTAVGVRSLPWYMLDLTAVNNFVSPLPLPSAPVLTTSFPMVQLKQEVATGNMYFGSVTNKNSGGVTDVAYYSNEQAPSPTSLEIAPFTKSMVASASIQANLWGAKSKATKYMVQVVRISDDDLIPDHDLAGNGTELSLATQKRNDFYQSLIKPWTFNPIATTGGIHARKYKVLKTQTITIDPNPTTDGDADPQCVVYKAFLQLNKICDYTEKSNFLQTDVATNDRADYANNNGVQCSTQINPRSRIYLVIRATNYGVDAGDTNAETPSFDLSVRIKHTIPK